MYRLTSAAVEVEVEVGEQVPWIPYGNIPVMLIVTMSPMETSGVYGEVEVA